jgi:outer membrane protein OmpA-like peptidoglycan-associated protein
MNPVPSSRLRRAAGVAALWLLGAVAVNAAEVAIQPGRPSASRSAEPAQITALQQRLDERVAPEGSNCDAEYTGHKTQAWINFAKYAAAEHLPQRVQSAAADHAAALLQALDAHGAAPLDTPELPGAHHVRDDLWRAIDAVKHDGRRCAAPKMTAYCEVQLAWVDYEAAAGGWRHVDPYVRIAEDYCGTAVASHATALPEPPPPAPEPAAPPAAGPAPEPPLVVLFPHNRARPADIRRPGRAELKALAARMKSMPPGARLVIVGNADLTGHTDYNLRLSARRARSVAQELASFGIAADRMQLSAVGSSEPVVQCASNTEVGERRRYLHCLEPNRRVFIRLVVE